MLISHQPGEVQTLFSTSLPVGEVGNSLTSFSSESLIFCERKSNVSGMLMVAMLVMSDLSESLRMRFCKEPREQIAQLLFKKEQMSEERCE